MNENYVRYFVRQIDKAFEKECSESLFSLLTDKSNDNLPKRKKFKKVSYFFILII